MEEKILEIQKILKDWLQNKEDIVFTDDIAISEISEEIAEIVKVVNEFRMQGRYYTGKEIQEIQELAYDEGLNVDRSEL